MISKIAIVTSQGFQKVENHARFNKSFLLMQRAHRHAEEDFTQAWTAAAAKFHVGNSNQFRLDV